MNVFIKEWSDIQNVVVDKSFHKFALDELGANEHDICELLNPEMCEKTIHCILYKPNKCVNKLRTHSLHKPSVILKSKSGNSFIVLDSMYLSKVQLTTTQVDMYYCMVRSLHTNIIYVLFSSGIVLTQNDLQNNQELNNNLSLLIAKLSGITKNNKREKIVLGGHSMGCVLALYTGFLMRVKPVFTNCYIVGTAGAKWIPRDIKFCNLENIKIFISGELRHSKTGDNLFLDCFINDGDIDLVSYNPVTVIYYDTTDRSADSVPFDKIESVITYPDKSSSQCKKFHMWSYYQGLISILCKDIVITQVKNTIKAHKTNYSKTQYNINKISSRSFTRSNSNSLI
jgi:hypothetical protein